MISHSPSETYVNLNSDNFSKQKWALKKNNLTEISRYKNGIIVNTVNVFVA